MAVGCTAAGGVRPRKMWMEGRPTTGVDRGGRERGQGPIVEARAATVPRGATGRPAGGKRGTRWKSRNWASASRRRRASPSTSAMPRSTRTQSGLACGSSNASVSMRPIASPLARVCGCTANSMISSPLPWSVPMMSIMISASRIANESVTVTANPHNACASQSNSSNRGSSIHVRHVSSTGSGSATPGPCPWRCRRWPWTTTRRSRAL